jgi:hypothetical protein
MPAVAIVLIPIKAFFGTLQACIEFAAEHLEAQRLRFLQGTAAQQTFGDQSARYGSVA